MNSMRASLDLPEALIEEARRAVGFKSKTDTVILALTQLLRCRRIEQLKELMGNVQLEIDRRRPPRP